MNPEVPVWDASLADQVIRVVEKGTAEVCAIAGGEPLTVGIVDEKAVTVITDEDDNVAKRGEVPVDNCGIAAG